MAAGAIYWTQFHSVGMCPTRIQQVSSSNTRIASVKTEVCSVAFPQSTVKYKLCMYIPLHRLTRSRSHIELSMQTRGQIHLEHALCQTPAPLACASHTKPQHHTVISHKSSKLGTFWIFWLSRDSTRRRWQHLIFKKEQNIRNTKCRVYGWNVAGLV
jgi:hypothetical protein